MNILRPPHLVSRRRFNAGLAYTVAIAPLLINDTVSAAVEPQAGSQQPDEKLLLIVTARSIFSEPGIRKFQHKDFFTKNNFNSVFNRRHFSKSDRFVINDSFMNYVKNSGDTINIFVHGFNTGWDDSIKLAEQLFQNLGTSESDSLDVLFNWPSASVQVAPLPQNWILNSFRSIARTAFESALKLPVAIVQEYVRSLDKVSASAEKLTNLLFKLTREFPDKKINLIAHSMGSRIALQAIHDLARAVGKPSENAISQLILASPDINYEEFNRLFDRVFHTCGRTTLYTCNSDLALYISHKARGEKAINDRLRIGVPNLDLASIQRKGIDYLIFPGKSFQINHRFFVEDECIYSDMAELINIDRGASKRIQNRSIGKKLKQINRQYANAFRLNT